MFSVQYCSAFYVAANVAILVKFYFFGFPFLSTLQFWFSKNSAINVSSGRSLWSLLLESLFCARLGRCFLFYGFFCFFCSGSQSFTSAVSSLLQLKSTVLKVNRETEAHQKCLFRSDSFSSQVEVTKIEFFEIALLRCMSFYVCWLWKMCARYLLSFLSAEIHHMAIGLVFIYQTVLLRRIF